MKPAYLIVSLMMLLSLSSCEIIGDIFKAGVWIGILLVAAVVIIIIWIANKFRKR